MTKAFDWIAAHIKTAGVKGFFVSGVSDVYGANPNDNNVVARFLNKMRRAIPVRGFCMLIAHFNQDSAKRGADAIGTLGTGAWHNKVRNGAYFYPTEQDSKGRTTIDCRKNQYGENEALIRLRFDTGSGMFVRETANDAPPRLDVAKMQAIARWVEDAEDAGVAITYQQAATDCASKPGFDEVFGRKAGAARKSLNKVKDAMIGSGYLVIIDARAQGKHHRQGLVDQAGQVDRPRWRRMTNFRPFTADDARAAQAGNRRNTLAHQSSILAVILPLAAAEKSLAQIAETLNVLGFRTRQRRVSSALANAPNRPRFKRGIRQSAA